MSLPPLAALVDIEDRLPSDLTDADRVRAEAALEDASILIRDEGLAWEDPDTAPDIVRLICRQVALRAINLSPKYGSETDTTGDIAIYLRKTERVAVRRAAGKTDLTTITTTRGCDDLVDYRPVAGGGDPIPFGMLDIDGNPVIRL